MQDMCVRSTYSRVHHCEKGQLPCELCLVSDKYTFDYDICGLLDLWHRAVFKPAVAISLVHECSHLRISVRLLSAMPTQPNPSQSVVRT